MMRMMPILTVIVKLQVLTGIGIQLVILMITI